MGFMNFKSDNNDFNSTIVLTLISALA